MKELCLAGGEASPTCVRAEMGSWQVEKHGGEGAIAEIPSDGSNQKLSSEKHILWQHFQELHCSALCACPLPLGRGQCRLGMGGDKYQHSKSFCMSLYWDPCHQAFI